MKHSEIASSYNNWIEYFDTNRAMTEAEFDATPMEKRLALIKDAFGAEQTVKGLLVDEHAAHGDIVTITPLQEHAAEPKPLIDEVYNALKLTLPKMGTEAAKALIPIYNRLGRITTEQPHIVAVDSFLEEPIPTRKLNDREINTILHALRILQEMRQPAKDGRGCKDAEELSSAYTACDHFMEGLKPLNNPELDALCESIGLDSLTLEIDETLPE